MTYSVSGETLNLALSIYLDVLCYTMLATRQPLNAFADCISTNLCVYIRSEHEQQYQAWSSNSL